MTENMKSRLNTPEVHDLERVLDDVIDDAALDFSDVQVASVMNVMFDLLRDRSNFLQKHIDALETSRKTPDQYPSAEECDSWVKEIETKTHNRLRGLIYDGIDFEDKRVQEAFDVGCRLLKLCDDYVHRPMLDLLKGIPKKTE
jgi:hypothetical protein